MNTEAVLFEYFAGNDVTLRLTLANDDGTPVNLTGCTLFLTEKRRASDSDDDAILKKTWGTHTNAAGGVSEVELTKEETAEVGRWVTDIQMKDSGGKVRTLAKGYAVVNQKVTGRTS